MAPNSVVLSLTEARMPLTYEDTSNEVRRISLSGRLDTVGSEEIAEELASLAASANRGVVVDLSQVTFLSSMGIRALISAAKARQANGGRMVLLVDGSDVVVRTLEATGVDELIPVYDDAEDAERAVLA
jgi:anti-anti-sigma factor